MTAVKGGRRLYYFVRPTRTGHPLTSFSHKTEKPENKKTGERNKKQKTYQDRASIDQLFTQNRKTENKKRQKTKTREPTRFQEEDKPRRKKEEKN